MWTRSKGKDILNIRTIAEIHRCEPTFRYLRKKQKNSKSCAPFVWKNQQNLWGEEKKSTCPEAVGFSTCHIGFCSFPSFVRSNFTMSEKGTMAWTFVYLLGDCTRPSQVGTRAWGGWFGQHLQPLMTKNLRPTKDVVGTQVPNCIPINRVLFTLLWKNTHFWKS